MFDLSDRGNNNATTPCRPTVVYHHTPRYQLLLNQGSSGPPLNVVSTTPASSDSDSQSTAAVGNTPVVDVQKIGTHENGAKPAGDCSDPSEPSGDFSEGCVASIKQGVAHFSAEQQKIEECNNLLSLE